MTGVLQGCLLGMGVWFEYVKKTRGNAGKVVSGSENGHAATGEEAGRQGNENGNINDERTGLLANER